MSAIAGVSGPDLATVGAAAIRAPVASGIALRVQEQFHETPAHQGVRRRTLRFCPSAMHRGYSNRAGSMSFHHLQIAGLPQCSLRTSRICVLQGRFCGSLRITSMSREPGPRQLAIWVIDSSHRSSAMADARIHLSPLRSGCGRRSSGQPRSVSRIRVTAVAGSKGRGATNA